MILCFFFLMYSKISCSVNAADWCHVSFCYFVFCMCSMLVVWDCVSSHCCFNPLLSSPSPALLPLHFSHGEQRHGEVRPRQRWPLVGAGGLLGRDPEQRSRHVPRHSLLQGTTDCRWRHRPAVSQRCCKDSHSVHFAVCLLQVMVDVDDKNEWKECIDIGGVRLPTGYFFGASAATGDLSGGFSGSLC